jgi:proliferating cell nuclear antigen
LKIVFFDARVWRYVISAISKVIEEGVFIVDPEKGFRFRAMDPSHIILLDLWFPVEAFEEFEVDEKVEIGVSLEDVAKVLRRARKEDKLEISAEDSKFSLALLGRGRRKFSLPVLDITAEEIPEPELEFKAEARVMSDVYRDTIKDVELVGDVIKFEAREGELRVSSSSELGEAEVVLSVEAGSLVEINVDGVQTAMYSLEYFSELSSAARVADAIVIKFSSDMPALVEHELPQGAKFSFLIAPRAE